MRMKIWTTILALMAGIGMAQAQDIYVSGRVIAAPYFDAGHRLLFSQNDYTYGTSRSAAMGGAFTSLGADLSSMSINPAGLGMYQSSDWGFTQALSIDGMNTTSPFMRPGALAAGGNKISYGLNNVGAAYNVFNGSGSLTSLTLGFSYNRTANFNSRTRVETFGEDSSIADMFARQLNLAANDSNHPIRPGDLEYSANPWTNGNIFLDEWGAVLGYQTGLTGINNEGNYGYFEGALPSDSYFGSVRRGGIYEYNFAVGANISNVLYFGTTVGVTEINFMEETSYEEFYTSGAAFDRMWFDQTTRIMGNGVTAKLGLVVRPVEALRLGVAFHLPTYYTLDKSYDGAMGSVTKEREYRSDTGNTLMDTQRFNSAPRLLTGVSSIIAGRAIVALDWEVAWYNKIRTRSALSSDIEASKTESQSLYKPGHTFRAGLEYLLSDAVSLRAGGTYMMDFTRLSYSNPYKNMSDNPATRNGFSVTGGVGFNLGSNGYLDMAYVYNRARMTDYDFYFYDDGSKIASQYDMSGGSEQLRSYTPTRTRHMITLTLGSRF